MGQSGHLLYRDLPRLLNEWTRLIGYEQLSIKETKLKIENMNTSKKQFVSMMMLLSSIIAFGQEDKVVSFDYPIKPSTEEWAKYNSTLDRIKVLQIPETTLKRLATESLLDICLDYPFLLEVCLDGKYQKNFELITSQFNGLQELLGRKDLYDALLEKNETLMDEASLEKLTDVKEKTLYAFKCFAVEFILTQQVITDNIVIRSKLPEVFSSNSTIRKQHEDIFWSINDVPYKIMQNSNYLKSITSLSPPSGYIAANVRTPNNTLIEDSWRLTGPDFASNSQEYIYYMTIYSQHSSASLIEVPSKKYNCHGYAWHYYDYPIDSNKVWIGYYTSAAEDVYWNDESYIEVPEAIGEKVSYSGDHSAIRLPNNRYISKWQYGVLTEHDPNDVPSSYLNGTTYKRFYIRKPYSSFTGPSFVTSSGTYSIVNLQSGFTVEWNLSDSYYNSNCIQKNYPNANQCVITCSSNHQMINATLTATIKKSGYTVKTLTKTVSAYTGFYGTYYNGQTTKQINLPSPLYVLPSTFVTITSPNLIGASLSFQGSYIPSSWQHNGTTGTLQFGMPSTVGATLVITVTSNGSTYYLPVIVASSVYSMSVESADGQISVCFIPDTGDAEYSAVRASSDCAEVFRLEIYNVTTGEKVFAQSVEGLNHYIQTMGWKKGIYLVRAAIGNQTISDKIIVK